MDLTKKEFHAYAVSATPGDTFMIQKASGWQMNIGWLDHVWIETRFVSYDGKEAIFEDKLPPNRKIWVSFSRQIKTGEVRIVWERSDIFAKTLPTDFDKNNVVKLWKPGELKFYK